MIELEENNKKLQMLNQKIQELGDSLWHRRLKKQIKWIRRKNN